jgi:hypothetical protein
MPMRQCERFSRRTPPKLARRGCTAEIARAHIVPASSARRYAASAPATSPRRWRRYPRLVVPSVHPRSSARLYAASADSRSPRACRRRPRLFAPGPLPRDETQPRHRPPLHDPSTAGRSRRQPRRCQVHRQGETLVRRMRDHHQPEARARARRRAAHCSHDRSGLSPLARLQNHRHEAKIWHAPATRQAPDAQPHDHAATPRSQRTGRPSETIAAEETQELRSDARPPDLSQAAERSSPAGKAKEPCSDQSGSRVLRRPTPPPRHQRGGRRPAA